MKGQVSLEYILIIGAVLIVTIPLFYYGLSRSNETIRINQAEETIKTIVGAADNIYSSGLGGKKIVSVSIPSGVVSGGVYANIFVLNLSIFGGTSEFIRISKADLVATQDFLNKIKIKGTYHVPIETFRDIDNKVKVLLGGSCGDNICSSTESVVTCPGDCTSFCPDLVCDPTEDCICSDCYGLQDGCPVNEICDISGSGQCVATTLISCGDDICTGLVGDNCNDCPSDCPTPQGYSCCPYDPSLQYYVLWPDSQCPVVPPSVSDCGDYCVFIGPYNNGWCRQTPTQCTKNNEIYVSGGDQYCSGSPTGDKCCCVPN
jgi:hypothetical protein